MNLCMTPSISTSWQGGYVAEIGTYCCFSSGRGLTPPTDDSSSRWTAVLKRFQNAGSRTPDIVVYVLVLRRKGRYKERSGGVLWLGVVSQDWRYSPKSRGCKIR